MDEVMKGGSCEEMEGVGDYKLAIILCSLC